MLSQEIKIGQLINHPKIKQYEANSGIIIDVLDRETKMNPLTIKVVVIFWHSGILKVNSYTWVRNFCKVIV